jgi:hypothetical protein
MKIRFPGMDRWPALTFRRALTGLAVAAALGLCAAGPGLAAEDPMAGAWRIRGEVQSFSFTLTCRFTRSGEALSGTCFDGGTNRPHPLTSGTVTGSQVRWTYQSSFMGQPFKVEYVGTLKDGTISGAVDAAGRKGRFSGSR